MTNIAYRSTEQMQNFRHRKPETANTMEVGQESEK